MIDEQLSEILLGAEYSRCGHSALWSRSDQTDSPEYLLTSRHRPISLSVYGDFIHLVMVGEGLTEGWDSD